MLQRDLAVVYVLQLPVQTSGILTPIHRLPQRLLEGALREEGLWLRLVIGVIP